MARKRSTFHERASRAAWTVCGARVQHISFPGGRSRDSVRLHFGDGRTIIATRRHRQERADLEVEVLQRLHRAGAPVPAVLSYDRDILLQEDVGDQRASISVFGADAGTVGAVLDSAIESLVQLQRAGSAAALATITPTLGIDAEWRRTVAETPLRIAEYFDLERPAIDIDAIAAAIDVRVPTFIKWDARLGNAAVGKDKKVYWFDFEHCGARNALDDLAWMLGDEYLPDVPSIEDRIFAARLEGFQVPGDPRAPEVYLAEFGVLHIAMRLALLLERKSEVGWVDAKDGAQRDKIGASRDLAVSMARRAARWARRAPGLVATEGTFSNAALAIEAMA